MSPLSRWHSIRSSGGATELVHIGQAVMALGGSVAYFVDHVFNYPTLAECYEVAALHGLNKLRPSYLGTIATPVQPADQFEP